MVEILQNICKGLYSVLGTEKPINEKTPSWKQNVLPFMAQSRMSSLLRCQKGRSPYPQRQLLRASFWEESISIWAMIQGSYWWGQHHELVRWETGLSTDLLTATFSAYFPWQLEEDRTNFLGPHYRGVHLAFSYHTCPSSSVTFCWQPQSSQKWGQWLSWRANTVLPSP